MAAARATSSGTTTPEQDSVERRDSAVAAREAAKERLTRKVDAVVTHRVGWCGGDIDGMTDEDADVADAELEAYVQDRIAAAMGGDSDAAIDQLASDFFGIVAGHEYTEGDAGSREESMAREMAEYAFRVLGGQSAEAYKVETLASIAFADEMRECGDSTTWEDCDPSIRESRRENMRRLLLVSPNLTLANMNIEAQS